MKMNIMKLFRDLMKFGKVETPEGILIYEGDVLAEGTEVFIEDAEGNIVPAPDGTYGEYEVKEGKIAPKAEEAPETEEKPAEEESMAGEEPATEEAPATEEPATDDKEERIAALEAAVAELKAALEALAAAKEEQEFSNLKPAEKEIKDIATNKTKGAMKYFE